MEPLEFSESLRRVLGEARQEATRLRHEHIGTEHLLFALLRDEKRGSEDAPTTASVALDLLGVDRQKLGAILQQTVLPGLGSTVERPITYTSRAKAVLELALAEARVLKHDAVRPEHLLLGLIREERGVAAQVLLDQGVTVDKVRSAIARLT
jgi:ATP-dependent Clp protease ATP-binding subunit ClpC